MVNRLSRHGLLLALSVALLAPAAEAQAPQTEKIALHPCVITGGKKADVSDLEAICATAAVRETMNLVPSTDVRTFLEKEHGSCAKAKNRNACLGRLAAATKATRSLYITINPFTPKITRVTGLVVDEAGKKTEEKSLELSRIANQPPRDVVRFAVSQILDQLAVTKAPPPEVIPPTMPGTQPEPEPLLPPGVAQPTQPPPTPSVTAPPVTAVREEAPRGPTWKTPVGITTMAVGGAGLVASAVLVFMGNSDAKEFNDAFAGKLPAQADLARLDSLQDSANSKHKLAAISASAGAALAIGGAILWLTDGPSSPKEGSSQGKAGSARILLGPGQVGVLVRLP